MRTLTFVVPIPLMVATAIAAHAQPLSREPPMGGLKPGQRALVDDGTCGPGKIKEVVGGDHVAAGGRGHTLRVRRCIPRR